MIELKQNKIWSDSLSSVLGLDQPWDNIEKPLQKFICFGEGGDSGGAGDGDAETDVEFGEPITGMTATEAVAATSAAEAQAGLGAAADAAATVQAIQNLDPIPKGLIDPTVEFLGITYTPTPKAAGLYGAPAYSNIGLGFSLGEFAADVVEAINPFAGLAVRGLASLTGKADALGLNTQNPIAEVENLARGLGFQGLAETVAPVAQAVDTATTAVQGLASDALGAIGVDVGPTSAPTEAPISTAASTPSSAITSSEVDDFDFEPASDSEISRGITSIAQNPLEVRPQEEVQPSSRFGNFIRRPFVFTPGRIFAQTGGGIQSLINEQPTLLDVVNKGMAIPEETIPSQRPQPFIKGQQPGGLRSTNYYTNAMQPASFYAQPQQVKNYGSIY